MDNEQMKQMFIFDSKEAANIIAQGIATSHGIVVEKVEYEVENNQLIEIRAWREERGTKTETD